MHRPQGWVSPALLVDGMIAVVWRHERRGSRLDVTIEPFTTLAAKVRKGVEREVVRLSSFFDAEACTAWQI